MMGTKGSHYRSRAFIVSPKGHVGALGVPEGVGGRGVPPPLPKKKIKNSGAPQDWSNPLDPMTSDLLY